MRFLNAMVAICLILVIGGLWYAPHQYSEGALPQPMAPLELPEPNPEPNPDLEPDPELEPEPSYITLLGVGDNLIHKALYLQAKQRGGDVYDFSLAYESVKEYIVSVDIASINQETMMSHSQPASTYPRFNTPQSMGDTLVDLGFDVVNVANNHMFDMGATGLEETVLWLQSKEELLVVGAALSEEEMDIPVLWVGDIAISFLGATESTNGLTLPQSSPLVPSLIRNEEEISFFLSQIIRAKALSDVVVVNVHWGAEYSTMPNESQYSLAQQMVDAGADVILGHHPHVLQPMEYLTDSEGRKALVCYSLGNFISVQNRGNRMIGGMVEIQFEELGGEVTIQSAVLYPCITHYLWNYVQVEVIPYDKYTPELANIHGVREYSGGFSHRYIYDVVTEQIAPEFLPADWEEYYPYGERESA